MIYVCTVTRNDAATVGLLLWKVRQIFSTHAREFQFLVADDASHDGTVELLEPYQRALPLTLIVGDSVGGYAARIETLLREALARSDRPKRDAAIIIPSDFTLSPEVLPEMVKRLDSGADLVVAEAGAPAGGLAQRIVYRGARFFLRPGINVPGVRDYLSGFYAVRLATVKRALQTSDGPLLTAAGICARAELVARAAAAARQIATVTATPRPRAVLHADARGALRLTLALLRAGRQVRVPTGEHLRSGADVAPSTP